jgi:DNA polymerase I
MSERNHLYLVDGSAYIFRAYHRLPPLTDPQGTPVGAVYGYTTMLWKLADDLDKAEGPTHLAVILDKASTSFRNQLYDQYKANRPDPPEDLVPQFPLMHARRRGGAGTSPSSPPTRTSCSWSANAPKGAAASTCWTR